MDGANHIVQYLQSMYVTMKLYHWSTRSYARHMATDDFITDMLKTTDKLVETYMGRYSRPEYPKGFSLHVKQLDDTAAVEELREYGKWLKKDFTTYLKPSDTDLLTLRDELLQNLHQTLYRYSLQ